MKSTEGNYYALCSSGTTEAGHGVRTGRMLLGKNTRLTAENIKYIIFLGTGGVYVDDEISKDIELYDVVKPEVKNEAVWLIVALIFHYKVTWLGVQEI